MTAAPKIQGWCPGALRPMQSGDGLLLRAKTLQPRLLAHEAREIAAIARDCGNGLVDLSQRAQLQLRGVDETRLEVAQHRLAALGLLAKDAATESVLNFLVSPFADEHASALASRLARDLSKDGALQALPGKFGFLVDDGGALGLANSAMDIRLEAHDDKIAVIAEGAREQAFLTELETATDAALQLARAFLTLREGREFELRRMRNVVAAFGLDALAKQTGLAPTPYRSRCRAASAAAIFGVRPLPGPPAPEAGAGGALSRERSEGAFVGIGAPSGRLSADELGALADLADAHGLGELRLTPWRALLLPCPTEKAARMIAKIAAQRGLVVDAEDPRLAVIACPGAPECPQAQAPTRGLAAQLAPLAARLASEGARLHISGCAKGCAFPAAAKVALVATPQGFDLVDDGGANDAPTLRGLDANEIEDAMRARLARATTQEPPCPAH
ncbi:precorrin-3B synthase [Methylosinus sp. H3A]|uniref:precorrin-3B synthase n=1 Tax=Methylosinus sp. H3A TaxID=2785786 RepID=UPI0018C3100A|nr:precorrin-3B synthase [Methylosinus sp. H3A]MBG0810620.1 precorrin-3B synthase [Methylosinus sp. H3A]